MSPVLAVVLAVYITSPTDAASAMGQGIQKPHYSATPMPYEPPPPPYALVFQLPYPDGWATEAIAPFLDAKSCEAWGGKAMRPGIHWFCSQGAHTPRCFCGYNIQLANGLRVNSYPTEKECEKALVAMVLGKCLMEECPVS
jgi:hypothetical protein